MVAFADAGKAATNAHSAAHSDAVARCSRAFDAAQAALLRYQTGLSAPAAVIGAAAAATYCAAAHGMDAGTVARMVVSAINAAPPALSVSPSLRQMSCIIVSAALSTAAAQMEGKDADTVLYYASCGARFAARDFIREGGHVVAASAIIAGVAASVATGDPSRWTFASAFAVDVHAALMRWSAPPHKLDRILWAAVAGAAAAVGHDVHDSHQRALNALRAMVNNIQEHAACRGHPPLPLSDLEAVVTTALLPHKEKVPNAKHEVEHQSTAAHVDELHVAAAPETSSLVTAAQQQSSGEQATVLQDIKPPEEHLVSEQQQEESGKQQQEVPIPTPTAEPSMQLPKPVKEQASVASAAAELDRQQPDDLASQQGPTLATEALLEPRGQSPMVADAAELSRQQPRDQVQQQDTTVDTALVVPSEAVAPASTDPTQAAAEQASQLQLEPPAEQQPAHVPHQEEDPTRVLGVPSETQTTASAADATQQAGLPAAFRAQIQTAAEQQIQQEEGPTRVSAIDATQQAVEPADPVQDPKPGEQQKTPSAFKWQPPPPQRPTFTSAAVPETAPPKFISHPSLTVDAMRSRTSASGRLTAFALPALPLPESVPVPFPVQNYDTHVAMGTAFDLLASDWHAAENSLDEMQRRVHQLDVLHTRRIAGLLQEGGIDIASVEVQLARAKNGELRAIHQQWCEQLHADALYCVQQLYGGYGSALQHLRELTRQMMAQGRLDAAAVQAVDQWTHEEEVRLKRDQVTQSEVYVSWKQDAMRGLNSHYNEQDNDIERVTMNAAPFGKAPAKRSEVKSFQRPTGDRTTPAFVTSNAQRAMAHLPVHTREEAVVLGMVLGAAGGDAAQEAALTQYVHDNPVQAAALKERWLSSEAPEIEGWGKSSLSEQAANRDAHMRARLQLMRVMPEVQVDMQPDTDGVLAVLQDILNSEI
jgi:hypothetical protein